MTSVEVPGGRSSSRDNRPNLSESGIIRGMNGLLSLTIVMLLSVVPATDPYSSLSPDETRLLKPQIERWIRDQVKHDWSDLWEIQDQTPDLKNELLLGEKDAPDMDRGHYIEAMKSTIGIGYPEIKAFRLHEIRKENEGFWILGCGKKQRESWKQTSVTDVHARIAKGKALFGLPGGTPDSCRL
jgi:hypothetical protein